MREIQHSQFTMLVHCLAMVAEVDNTLDGGDIMTSDPMLCVLFYIVVIGGNTLM